MKKIFTLATLLVLALTVNAQETYRKSWDFTKWSAATVANLKAESAKGPTTGAWSDVEKATATEPTETSKDNCFWEVTAQGNATTPATLMANGEVIAELEGLGYTNTTARSLAIAVNYQQATAGELWTYNGASYLWLGSKTKNYFVIPHVAPGTTIKMGVESHKLSEARGVELYIGIGNSGTKLKDPDGNDVAIPTTYVDQEWLVPAEGLTDTPNEDGTFDVTIRNTNGCHLYYITVGDGDSPQVEEAKQVAYLHASGINMEEYTDLDYVMLDGNEKFDLTTIAATEDVTLESLADFDAVLISPSITKVKEANVVKPLIGFIPVINLNAGIYESLGLGKAVNTNLKDLTIVDPTNAIFEGIDAIEFEEGITAVELGDYFKNDAVLAKAGDNVAIHVHNPGRNAYYYIPNDMNTLVDLIPQVIVAAAKTKRAVAAVGTPVITFTQEDGQSVVTITAANSNAIYYTLDGTEPTAASTLYTEPFTLTDSLVVKAFATGDGYTDSEIAEKKIAIASKAAAPGISVLREAGKSTVTLIGAEGTQVYFNFAKSEKKDESQLCDTLITLTEPANITFFAVGEGKLQSDATTTFVGIDGIDKSNIRWDILAHMGGEKDEWSTVGSEESRSSKVNYIFGKTAQSMYTDEIESTESAKDSLGNEIPDSVIVTYKKVEQTVVPNVSGTWQVTSYGQVMTWEADGVITTVGAAGRNPETAFDVMPVNDSIGITNQFLNFKGKKSGEPYNATIQTAAKYAGPFDIVVYLCNGDKNGNYAKVNVEYSADGQNWTKIDTLTTHKQRFIKRTKLSYEGTDEVYVRLSHVGGGSAGQVFDIYLMNNGELSKAYNEETLGVQTVQPEGAVVRTEIFTLGGSRTANAGRGMQIIRKTYANGSVVTKKVLR